METKVAPLILLLGDSITQLAAKPECNGFEAKLSQDYVRKADVINRGIWGWNTRWWVTYLPQLFGEWSMKRPSLMCIFLGANDASLVTGVAKLRHVPLEEYQSNLRTIISRSRIAFPHCECILITPPAVDNSKWNPTEKLNAVTETYAKACLCVAKELNVPCIDIYEKTQGHWEWFSDGLHPNAEGMIHFYQWIQECIAKSYPHLTPQALPYIYPDIPPQD
jgi:lysophospholipase L1-like esterase